MPLWDSERHCLKALRLPQLMLSTDERREATTTRRHMEYGYRLSLVRNLNALVIFQLLGGVEVSIAGCHLLKPVLFLRNCLLDIVIIVDDGSLFGR